MQVRFGILSNPALRTYVLTGGFLVATIFLGFVGVAASRQLYMIGCIFLGYIAWRDSPGRHFEIAIVLFSFTPFVRRVIDASCGYDMLGTIISGPLLTLLVPCVDLRLFIQRPGVWRNSGPFILFILCMVYASFISVFQGDFQPLMIQLIKWGTPVLYGLWMLDVARYPRNNIIEHASRAFLIVTPIMGIYGVEQYLNPAPWDRFWMIYSDMGSIGTPEPFGVRVFSTMNSPATFATFATAGLIIFSFTRRGYQAAFIGITIALSLLLSQYRTAWIAMSIGVVYSWLYPKTRGRASVIAVVAVIVAILAVTSGGPIGDVISQRFDTLGQGAEDGSAKERMSEYHDFYLMTDDYIFGQGFSRLIGDIPGLVALDGTIISCYLVMGIFVGTLCISALIWAAYSAVSKIALNDSPMRVATGAVVIGMILTMPLAGITAGESGFLFWSFVAIAISSPQQVLQQQYVRNQVSSRHRQRVL